MALFYLKRNHVEGQFCNRFSGEDGLQHHLDELCHKNVITEKRPAQDAVHLGLSMVSQVVQWHKDKVWHSVRARISLVLRPSDFPQNQAFGLSSRAPRAQTEPGCLNETTRHPQAGERPGRALASARGTPSHLRAAREARVVLLAARRCSLMGAGSSKLRPHHSLSATSSRS